MKKQSNPVSARKPPTPNSGHQEIEDWIKNVMPALNPIVERLDKLIRDTIPGLEYAVKWKKAYYGMPTHGWIIEMVAYDVSVNVVFLGGADFDSPPPLGEGDRSRYVKVKDSDDIDEQAMKSWIEQAAKNPGWSA